MLSLGDLIASALLQFVWIILIQGPLCLISIASLGLNFLVGGLQWIVFFNAQVSVQNGVCTPPTWSEVRIPWPFIGMLIVSIVIGLVVFIIKVANLYASGVFEKGNAKPFQAQLFEIMRLALMSLIVSVLIPVFYFLLTIFLTFFVAAVTKIFSAGGPSNLADYIYLAGWGGDPNFPPAIPDNYGPPGNADILQYDFMVQLVGTWLTLFGVLLLSWIIIQKTTELMFLFIIGPIISAQSPYDDGKKMVIWKDTVIAKNCVLIANYIGYWLFMYFLQLWQNVVGSIDPQGLTGFSLFLLKSFLTLAYIGGSALALWQLGPLVASFFGDGFSFREGMSNMRTLLGAKGVLVRIGGAPLRGINKLAGKPFSKMGKKWAKQGKGGSGGGAGEAESQKELDKMTAKEEFSEGTAKGKGFMGAVWTGAKVLTKSAGRAIKRTARAAKDVYKYTDGTDANFHEWAAGGDQKNFKRVQKSAFNGNSDAKSILNKYDRYKEKHDAFDRFDREDRMSAYRKEYDSMKNA